MSTSLTRTDAAPTLTPAEMIIRDFLLQEVLYDNQLADLGPEDSLLEAELLDSIAIMQIVAFCEQAFDIDIPAEELLPDHFENVRAIAKVVERRLAAKAG
jgi:methoxymalonate biosynthesis acyl carrier protein